MAHTISIRYCKGSPVFGVESFICCVLFGALAEVAFCLCVVLASCVADTVEPAVSCWTGAAVFWLAAALWLPASGCGTVVVWVLAAAVAPAPLTPSTIVPVVDVLFVAVVAVLFPTVPVLPESVAPSLMLPDAVLLTTTESSSCDASPPS